MANKYRATNILTGETVEDTARNLAELLIVTEANVYDASTDGHVIYNKWKITCIGKMLYKKVCPICNNEYDATVNNMIYCSKKCREAQYNQGYTSKKCKGYKKRTKSLTDIAKEAKKAGTSYGLLEAQKWAKENQK